MSVSCIRAPPLSHTEPHLPHVLIEDGDMTQEEYDEHLQGRSDFIKATKKDPSDDKKVWEYVCVCVWAGGGLCG